VEPIAATALEKVIELTGVAVASSDSPDVALIEGIDWEISAGDYWVVAGRPGVGKSELLAVAGGQNRPLAGAVRLFGREVSGLGGDEWLPERLRVGFVFDEGGRLFNQLTVEQNLALPLCYHRDCEAGDVAGEVREILELTGFTAQARSFPGRLNLAWRQRVALARALALRPDVLLLDNPLSGAQGRHVSWWLDFLARLSAGQAGVSDRPATLIVCAEHFNPWSAHARRFGLLRDHRLEQLGGRAEVEGREDFWLPEPTAAG